MTAAALRPDLFTHLFATQRPQREKSDAAATALSVLFHGAVAIGLVWASASVTRPEPRIVEEVIPVVPVVPNVAPRAESSAGGGGTSSTQAGRSLVVPDRFDAPVIDPSPSSTPFDADDFAKPGAPSSASQAPAGVGIGDGPMREGFEVRTVAPALLNPQEVQRALERNYPALLRDSGIGGRVTLWLLLDESGRVVQTDVKREQRSCRLRRRRAQSRRDDALLAGNEPRSTSKGVGDAAGGVYNEVKM